MNPEIILQKVTLPNNQVKLNLLIDNVPKNFLGIAFDLNFQKGKYDNFDLANNLKEGKLSPPIYLAKADNQQVIFGFTSKFSDLTHLQDGKIGSFLFNGAIDNISLNKLVLSSFNGKRIDLPNVTWKVVEGSANVEAAAPKAVDLASLKDGAMIGVLPVNNGAAAGDSAVSTAVMGTHANLDANIIATDLPKNSLTQQNIDNLLNKQPYSDSQPNYLWYLGGIFLILVILYILNRKFKFIKNKTKIRLFGKTLE